jgi:hypothetical protein
MASFIRRLVSSSVAAAPMHPGKSGTWALYPVDVGAYNTAYFISRDRILLILRQGDDLLHCFLQE